MTSDGFIDLDELLLLCRDENAKKYIAEAVGCYRAGAYRSCIVATWIAVVYDFLDKLRQLDLAGDAQAVQVLEVFERNRLQQNVKGSLEFERDVIRRSLDDFQIVSSIEARDLERLLEDRNRCAHPSMNSSDETYSPSAELARSHLRNAVIHVLQHPPVQGKAALDRLIAEVQSEYFPTTDEAARAHFQRGPLARPRESLVRNIVIVLLKTSLFGGLADGAFQRHAAALNAVRTLHSDWVDKTLQKELSRIARTVTDGNLGSVIAFISYVPDSWQFIEDDVRGRIKRFVEQLPADSLVAYLPFALTYAPLQEDARRRLARTTVNELISLVAKSPQIELVDHAIEQYASSANYETANSLGSKVIQPLAAMFTEAQIERVIDAAQRNSQVNESRVLGDVLRAIRSSERIPADRFAKLLVKNQLASKFSWLMGEPSKS